jgi:hypothetical protein
MDARPAIGRASYLTNRLNTRPEVFGERPPGAEPGDQLAFLLDPHNRL